MSTRLLERLDALIGMAPARSLLDADLRRVVQAHELRAAALGLANVRRRAVPPVQEAVRRAANRYLTPAMRRATDRAEWAGSLWRFLERGYVQVGLERRPCLKTVEKALQAWKEKPYGDLQARGYGGFDNQEVRDG